MKIKFHVWGFALGLANVFYLVLQKKKSIKKLEAQNRQSEELFLQAENSLNKSKISMLDKRLTLNDQLVSEIEQKLKLMQRLS